MENAQTASRILFGLRRRRLTVVVCIGLAMVAVVLLSIAVGAVNLPVSTTAKIILNRVPGIGRLITKNWTETQETIVMSVRLPRVLLAMLVGMGLSVSGAIFQSLFRNPMADPGYIGSSQGAAVGATIALFVGIQLNLGGLSAIQLFAFLGSLIAIVVVYSIARTGGRVSVSSLLLVGIAVSSFLASIVSTLMVISEDRMHSIMFWLMGGIGTANWNMVIAVLPFIIVGSITTMVFTGDLNLISMGEERAAQLGLNVERFRWVMLVVASLMVGAAVSVSGIIGFIGLITPHIVRLMTGPDHRYLVPGSLFGGGLLLVIADTIARTAIAPNELPVGIVTAFFGAPFFVYLLRRRGKTADRL